jgi:acetate---CoA ligase (ADP-forming)
VSSRAISTGDLNRLLAPRSVALIGGEWTDQVAAASRAIGFSGELWRIHPSRTCTPERNYYRSVDELPAAPDAAFVAAPSHAVPAIAGALAQRRAGGFVCFAAGFSELGTDEGRRLTRELLSASGELPFFGPNCYGFINFFDGAALWPDQVVGGRVPRGVAIICQSGTIALDILFNDRSLPLGLVLTVGNQTRLATEDLIEQLSDDARISAFGLYLEGVKDPARLARAVERAHAAGKPIALVKAGRSEAAVRAARSHTGALAGEDAVFDAFCRQAGLARCESLATLCETLKVLHAGGPLGGRRVLILGASGGDMAMTADAARNLGLRFPPLPPAALRPLRALLTERVSLTNPFDFHTFIWFDRTALRTLFSIALRAGFDAVGFMLDCPPAPPADASSYLAAIEELIGAHEGATFQEGTTSDEAAIPREAPTSRAAVISSLPESLGRATRERCLAAGVVPLQGQREALEALDLAGAIGETWAAGAELELRMPSAPIAASVAWTLSEHHGKTALSACGVRVPHGRCVPVEQAVEAAIAIGFPVVMKAAEDAIEHKSEVGGVVVDVRSPAEASAAARRLARLGRAVLVEEMVADGVAEILVGITVDAHFGQVLLLGAGGVLTELLRDTVTLLPPFTADAIEAALRRLAVAKLLAGFRGRPAGDVPALVATALACAQYAHANVESLVELDVNPVIVRPAGRGAVAADVLIRMRGER